MYSDFVGIIIGIFLLTFAKYYHIIYTINEMAVIISYGYSIQERNHELH